MEDLEPKLFGPLTSEGTGAAKEEVSMSLEALGDPVQHAVAHQHAARPTPAQGQVQALGVKSSVWNLMVEPLSTSAKLEFYPEALPPPSWSWALQL